MHGKNHSGGRIGRALLCVALCVMMAATLLPYAAAEELTGSQQPVLVVTGQGILEDGEYSAANVGNERAYTLAELMELGANVVRRYSTINSAGTKRIYLAEGIDLKALLGEFAEGSVTIVASDGFSRTIDLSQPRYYYPELANDDEAGFEETECILAWKSAYLTAPEIPEVDQMEEHSLRLFVGQANIADVNNSLLVSDVTTVLIGDAIAETALTVFGKELTRAEILMMPRTEHVHMRVDSGGSNVETPVKGLLLAELLDTADDNDVISFATVDEWDEITVYTMTKAELVARNAILAYEHMSGDTWMPYYRSTDYGPGYFRLWVDGIPMGGGAHGLSRINLMFDDIGGYEWASDAIVGLAQAGLISGKSEGKFAPGDTLKRGEIVTILGRVLKAELPETVDAGFEDVDYDLYYGPYIQWASMEGIVQGYGDGTFGPENTILESHLALLAQNVGLSEIPDGVDPGADAESYASRAQMAVVMYALLSELG